MRRSDMRQVADKWEKFNVLKQHEGVSVHIPPMLPYNAENLKQMLDRHGFIVVKPLVGAGGHGVVKIVKNNDGSYGYHYRRKFIKSLKWDNLIVHINRIRRGRKYMIQ